MRQVDLDALGPADIPKVLEAVHRYLMENGLALITENIFLKTEALARRWELSESCLSHWRFTGGGPVYIKTGPGPKSAGALPAAWQERGSCISKRVVSIVRPRKESQIENYNNQLNYMDKMR